MTTDWIRLGPARKVETIYFNRSIIMEVLMTASVDQILLNLLVSLALESLTLALFHSLLMRCSVYRPITLEKISDLVIDLFLLSFAPARWFTV